MLNDLTYAKCCYCGQKTILDKGALKCDACGAPLTKFGAIQRNRVIQANRPIKPQQKSKSEKRFTADAVIATKKPKSHKRPKKKSTAKRFFDFVEDAFDEITDILD